MMVGALLVALSFSASSCVPLAVGAAGGYILNQQGYRVQSPLTKKPASSAAAYEEPAYEDSSYQEPAAPVYTEY